MSDSCKNLSGLPAWLTIGFFSAAFTMLIITSYISYKSVKSASNKTITTEKELDTKQSNRTSTIDTSQDGCCRFMWSWMLDVWSRKNVYIPLIFHLMDTSTDFAAVAEFYIIGTTSTPQQCGGLNVWWLFILSIAAMVAYRSVSSYTIWRITGSFRRVFLQFIDIELFEVLYISHRLKLKNKSSPQRLVSVLEAVFEAAPQSMIQMVYLLKTGNLDGIIFASAILSFILLTMTIIGDDKEFLKIKFKDIGYFLMLHFYRMCDVPVSILIYVFVWYYINGYVLSTVVGLDIIVAIICFLRTKSTDALLSVIAMPLSFGGAKGNKGDDIENKEDKPDTGDKTGKDDEADKEHNAVQFGQKKSDILKIFWCYAFFRCLVVNSLLLIWIAAINDDNIFNETFGATLWLFCCVASLIRYCFFGVLYKYYDLKKYIDRNKEKNDVNALINSGYYDDAIELIFYKTFDVTKNSQNRYGSQGLPLLEIAYRCNRNQQLFPFILTKLNVDLSLDVILKEGRLQKYPTLLFRAVINKNAKIVEHILNVAGDEYIAKCDSDRKTAAYYSIEIKNDDDNNKEKKLTETKQDEEEKKYDEEEENKKDDYKLFRLFYEYEHSDDYKGKTTLMNAAQAADVEILQKLLKFPDMDFDYACQKTQDNTTAFYWALRNNAGIDAFLERANNELNLSQLWADVLSHYDDNGQTLLMHITASSEDPELLERIMNEVDWEYIKKKDNSGKSACYLVIKKANEKMINRFFSCADRMKNDDNETRKLWSDAIFGDVSDDRTLLMHVAENGKQEVIQTILDRANWELINKKDSEGKTAFYYIIKRNNKALINVYLKKVEMIIGDDLESDDKIQKLWKDAIPNDHNAAETFLMFCAKNRYKEFISAVMATQNFEYINKQYNGNTALYYALRWGTSGTDDGLIAAFLDGASLIIKNESQPEEKAIMLLNNMNGSALHIACNKYVQAPLSIFRQLYDLYPSQESKVEALNKRDNQGDNILDLCERNNLSDINEFVLQELKNH